MNERMSATVGKLAGRKLLVLGAGPFQMPVIDRAMRLGCVVVTADNVAANPGHQVAHRSAIVSTVDRDAILELAAAEEIDGVLTYGSDVSAPTAAFVAEQLGLPGNPSEVVGALQRKHNFRALQDRLGLPHPKFVAASNADQLVDEARSLRWPLIVKPADSSGSKGQKLVTTPDELRRAFDDAAGFSRSGVVIAEERLVDDILELVGEVLLQSGEVRFAAYGHNYFSDDRWPRVPSGEIVPGTFGSEIVEELDRQIAVIVAGAGLRTGCMNFDAIVSDGRVVILDIGLRNGGNLLPDLIELSTGVDLTTAAIHCALGVRCEVSPSPVPTWAVSHVIHSRDAGILQRIVIDPDLERELSRTLIFRQPGDLVQPYTRGDHGLGLILASVAGEEEAIEFAANVHRRYRVEVAAR